MTLTITYSLLIIGASVVGGLLPIIYRFSHTGMQMIMSFVSGLMLGIAVYHLLPHSLLSIDADFAMQCLMAGLVIMFLLLRLFHFHQHDMTAEDHNHQDEHDDCSINQANSHHSLNWVGVAIGMSLHTLIDGIALGASIIAGGPLAGFAVFIAIILHKPLDAMTITSLMSAGGWSRQLQMAVNVGFALMVPVGIGLVYLGINLLDIADGQLIGAALAFTAGAFICISLSDLLPEIQFHSHDRLKLTSCLLAGILLAFSLTFIEPDHLHGDHDSHQPAHKMEKHDHHQRTIKVQAPT